jgi:hypothetical protein
MTKMAIKGTGVIKKLYHTFTLFSNALHLQTANFIPIKG